MTDRQRAAIAPLLAALTESMIPFHDEPDNGAFSPFIHLTLAQWRAIQRELAE